MRTRRSAALLLLCTVVAGCGTAAAAQESPVPQAGAAAGHPATCAGGQRMADLLGALAAGSNLSTALAAVYAEPVAALSGPEATDALHLLAGLDSCGAVPTAAKADVPMLIRTIALGAPAPPLRDDPPPAAS